MAVFARSVFRALTGRRAVAALFLVLVLATSGGTAWAHPHVWISARVSLVFEDRALTAMEVTWTFDDLYSTLIREDFDKNGDGKLDTSELAEIARNQLEENLGDYSYFTHLQIGGERRRVTEVDDFRAHFKDELLGFTFRVPMPDRIDPNRIEFAFGLYDEEYYIEFSLDRDEPIRIGGDAPSGCKPVVGYDSDNPIYFGAVNPMRVTLNCHVG